MQTNALEIVEIIQETAQDGENTLGQKVTPLALIQAKALEQAVQDSLEHNPIYRSMWQQFRANPQANAPILVGVIQVICQNDIDLSDKLNTLLKAYQQAIKSTNEGNSTNINTGGGAYIGGSVQLGRDSQFIGRDQTITSQNSIEVAQSFENLYLKVATHPHLTSTDRADIKSEIEDIEREITSGVANEQVIHRRLRNIQRMAPDILDVVISTLANPVLGMGVVIRKIADKMRSEAGTT